MATTNLIVDFLVIGIVSSIWLTPIAILVIQNEFLEKISQLGAESLPLILGLTYILGISVSRFADDITKKWDEKWKNEIFGNDEQFTYHNKLNYVIAKSESASDYLSYRRSVIRTSRACLVSFVLGFILWVIVAIFKPTIIPPTISFFLASFSIVLAVWLFRAWSTVLKGYFHSIKDFYSYLFQGKRNEEPEIEQ